MQNHVDHNLRVKLDTQSRTPAVVTTHLLDLRLDVMNIHPIIFTDTTQSRYEYQYDALELL